MYKRQAPCRIVGRGHDLALWDVDPPDAPGLPGTDSPPMSRTTSTILPPPSDFPVPMPEMVPAEPDSGTWRALVEVTKDTVRPGALHESDATG